MVNHFLSLEDINLSNVWLTIGTFDGVHLGHQTILRRLHAGAQEANAPAVVLTFHPHPAIVFGKRNSASSITLPNERAKLLGDLGIDVVITQPFDMQTAGTSAQDFISLLKEKLGFVWLGVGRDFTLGKDRQGDVDYLNYLGKQYNYRMEVFTAVEIDGQVISSSRIRLCLEKGDVHIAAKMLGRFFRISGKVVRGDGRGRVIGIPTANLLVDEEKLIPTSGVYACKAIVKDEIYAAAVNIGVRPTFDGDNSKSWVEAHLVGFSGQLYGRDVSLDFIERLRGEQRFSGVNELVQQIHRDIDKTQVIVKI